MSPKPTTRGETLNIRAVAPEVARAIRAGAAAQGLTLPAYLEALLTLRDDVRAMARQARPLTPAALRAELVALQLDAKDV